MALPNVIDVNNTTSSALGSAATYTGTSTEVLPYSDITISVYAEPSTADGTLYFEFSQDGTNWDVSVPITVDDPTVFPPYPLRTVARFFRVKYTNGSTAQTAMRLQTLLHTEPPNDLTRVPSQTITDSEPVKVVESIIIGKNPSGTYIPVELSATGAISVATESETGLIQRQGFNSDVDTAATEDVWAAGGTRTAPTSGGQVSVSSDSVADTSAGTGARTVTIDYLDDTWVEQSETITMNGVVAVTTVATDVYRIQRMYVATAGAGGAAAGNITATISANTQAYITAGENDTQLSHYTVPEGKSAKFVRFTASQNGATADNDIKFQSRDPNGTGLWETFYIAQLDGNATSYVSDQPNAPTFTEHTDLRVTSTVSANNMSVAVNYELSVFDA